MMEAKERVQIIRTKHNMVPAPDGFNRLDLVFGGVDDRDGRSCGAVMIAY